MRKKLMTGICTLAMVLALGACGDGKSSAEDAGKENPVVTEQPSAGQEDTESKADSTDQKDEESDNKGEAESTDQKDEEPVPEVTPEVTEPALEVTPEVTEPAPEVTPEGTEPAPEVTPEVTEPVETDGTLGEVNVGETVVFGAYEQDGDTANGAEAVEWLVLDVTDGKALLLSRYGLEAMSYNETEEAMTWEYCTLRKWLNGEFYETAFSEEEKTEIVLTKLENKDNEEYGIEGGNDTDDKVFLLSVDEAKKYFAEDTVVEDGRNYNTERAAKPSAYAATKPLTIVTNGSWYDGSSPYWLRSPGVLNHIAAVVDYNGEIYAFGHGVGEPKDMVRPAVWVEIGE